MAGRLPRNFLPAEFLVEAPPVWVERRRPQLAEAPAKNPAFYIHQAPFTPVPSHLQRSPPLGLPGRWRRLGGHRGRAYLGDGRAQPHVLGRPLRLRPGAGQHWKATARVSAGPSFPQLLAPSWPSLNCQQLPSQGTGTCLLRGHGPPSVAAPFGHLGLQDRGERSGVYRRRWDVRILRLERNLACSSSRGGRLSDFLSSAIHPKVHPVCAPAETRALVPFVGARLIPAYTTWALKSCFVLLAHSIGSTWEPIKHRRLLPHLPDPTAIRRTCKGQPCLP